MNVDWFANNPKAKWYFVAAAVQLVLVLAVYLGIKHYTHSRRRKARYDALMDDFDKV
jgi:membrane protein YdbS with pleckstrin-like domain